MTVRLCLCLSIAITLIASAAMAAQLPTADLYIQPAACPGSANPESCKRQIASFTEDHAAALTGDYQGQRNVAYCLRTGCDGGIRRMPATSCAWRVVILASGSFSADESDKWNFETDCGALSSRQRQTALTQAGALFEEIYNKPLPGEFGG